MTAYIQQRYIYIIPFIFGFLLDLLLGDPQNLPHPIRLMGFLIEKGESLARKLPIKTFWQGATLSVVLIVSTWTIIKAIILLLLIHLGIIAVIIFETIVFYYAFSLKCLAKEAQIVLNILRNEGIIEARKRLSWLVSRDTKYLDETGVLRSLIETIAENFVDGVVSPYFYAFLLGPSGVMAFKMISTLDSMIGYKNKKYIEFGKVAAKLDDLANYIPARLSILFILLATLILRLNKPQIVFNKIKKEGHLHESPNSGLVEAAFAAALDVKLSGPTVYEGCLIERPYINEEGEEPRKIHVELAIKLLYVSSFIAFLCMVIIAFESMSYLWW